MKTLKYNVALAALVLAVAAQMEAGADQPARSHAAIVAEIIRADYAADLPALLTLYDLIEMPTAKTAKTARLHYWRGFARWRRAINGVNDGAPIAQMLDDLQVAEREFSAALEVDPAFVDAKAGLLSSLGIQLFLLNGDMPKMQPIIDRAMPLVKEALATSHDNPRMIWVAGQAEWRTPPDWTRQQVLARQERTIAAYLRGLELARAERPDSSDGLAPRWGEPELLMNLAWSHLNKAVPDPVAAERYAREALALVPHWHYVRDILLPQIVLAKK